MVCMRIQMIGLNEDKDGIISNIKDEYKNCVVVDSFNNDRDGIDTGEFCALQRFYDLFFFYFEPDFYNKYLKILKILSDNYEHTYRVYVICDVPDDFYYKRFEEECSIRFSNVNLELITYGMNDKQLQEFAAKKINSFFLYDLKFRGVQINSVTNEVILETDFGEMKIQFKKDVDMRLLTYFIRHYGKTLSLDNLLSILSEDPEYESKTIVESSINTIRRAFRQLLGINPIISKKKIGYAFQLTNDREEK